MTADSIISKVRSLCHTLRDEGAGYGDHLVLFTYAELAARDKTSLDLFWLKDDNLADLDNLPEPADLAEEIIENIEAGLSNFRTVAAQLQASPGAR
jgi:hypothetical protein